MSYPVGTTITTRTLDRTPGEHDATSPIILTVRNLTTGEVYLQVLNHYRDAHLFCQGAEDAGVEVLHVLEAEGDMAYGTSSGWIR